MPLPTSLPTDNTEREAAVKALLTAQIANLVELADFAGNLDFAFVTEADDLKGIRSGTNNSIRSTVRTDLQRNLANVGGGFAQIGALFAPAAPASVMTPAGDPPNLADKTAVRQAILDLAEDAKVAGLVIDQNPTSPTVTPKNTRIMTAVGREGQAEEDSRAAVVREITIILADEINRVANNLPMPPPAA